MFFIACWPPPLQSAQTKHCGKTLRSQNTLEVQKIVLLPVSHCIFDINQSIKIHYTMIYITSYKDVDTVK